MEKERPSKKQKEVFDYIETFINENGFGPSYREVMRALDLKSVSTVATHVNGLIARGYLLKKENSARSLQVVPDNVEGAAVDTEHAHLAWLRSEIAKRAIGSEEAETLQQALAILEGKQSATFGPAGSPQPEGKE